MAACSHSEAEVPLIPTVSFSRNSSGRRSARLRVRRSAPARAASSGIPNTLHKAAPCTAPSSAGSGNSQFPALPPFCAQTQTGLPAQCARQANIISSSFSVRARVICPGNVNSFSKVPSRTTNRTSSAPSSVLNASAAASRTASAHVCGGAVCSKYCSNTALTSILMRPARPS